MSLNRTRLWLKAWVLVFLMGAPAIAQGVRDMAPFAPADLSRYGGGPRPNEGLFFSFDWLYWGISAPDVTKIGDPTIDPQTVFIAPDQSYDERNSLDTGFIKNQFTAGTRFEFGSVMGHHGWIFSGFHLTPQEQDFIVREAHVLFKDTINTGGIGDLQGYVDAAQVWTLPNGELPRLPTIFNYVKAHNEIEPWSVELMYMYRTHPTHSGWQVELFGGARYMQIRERFSVIARDAPPTPPQLTATDDTTTGTTTSVTGEPALTLESGQQTTGGDDNTGGGGSEIIGRPNGVPLAPLGGAPNILADSYWNSNVENNIVGPQVGARIFKTWGRWTLSTEGRFFAGFNAQNLRQDGLFGSKLGQTDNFALGQTGNTGTGFPLVMQPTTFSHYDNRSEFSPGAELRVDVCLQLTRSVLFRAGWTGLWMDHIARASNIIDYQVPTMGINTSFRQQDIWLNGLNLGVIFNR